MHTATMKSNTLELTKEEARIVLFALNKFAELARAAARDVAERLDELDGYRYAPEAFQAERDAVRRIATTAEEIAERMQVWRECSQCGESTAYLPGYPRTECGCCDAPLEGGE